MVGTDGQPILTQPQADGQPRGPAAKSCPIGHFGVFRGGQGIATGENIGRLIRLLPDGSVDPGFSDGITGTDSEKTVESARLKTLCFDKTGTITFNTMSLA